MQNTILSVMMDLIMAGLLLATMVYCWRLNTRIRILQDSRSELARIIREFDESTTRATDSIAEIHKATARLSDNIQHKIDKANFLANDLEYMIEKGNKLAGKVDATPIRPARVPEATVQTAEMPRKEMPAPEKSNPRIEDVGSFMPSPRSSRTRSRAEQELMSMMGKKNSDQAGS